MSSYARKIININGADRAFVYDPESESLADVIRRYGLTGTKVSCRKGVCGACSVIVNGKVTRSCTLKMHAVPDFAKVITIEGLGTPMNLHPLQLAFITYGAIQCGFCTPGFIVSAYGLLLENPDPDRSQVRAWFQRNRNACRCTGYKQIVDAVMAAARVMRGEATMDDITFKPEAGYFNTRTPRPSGAAKACGTLDYGDDVAEKVPTEFLHLAIVQPKVAHHARIISIDVTEAEAMPGVVKVVTAKDVLGNNLINQYGMHKRSKVTAPSRPILCDKTLFRYGDVIGVVCADTREHARAAAAKVRLEYERLPEYSSFLESATPDARQVHPEGPNIYVQQPVLKGEDAASVIASSEYSVAGSFRSPREPHLSIEGDIVQAYWDEDGMLTVQCKSQSIYNNLNVMGKGIGVETEKLRILHNGVGGSFGWTTDPSSLCLAAICLLATGRPVSLSLSYEEFMHYSGKRTASHINGRLSCDATGKLTALEYDMGVDHGAYFEGDTIIGKLSCFGNPYSLPSVRGLVRLGVSNHNYGTAYRGYGFPQNTTGMESMMEMLAEKAGIDPFEFRRMNVLRDGQTTVNSALLTEYPYARMYDMAEEYYRQKKAEAAGESTPEIKKGVGVVSVYFNPTAGPMDRADCALEMLPDGRFRINDTWQDVGQGGDVGSLVFVLEALKDLSVTPADVVIDINDSKYCPNTGISASSRSHYMGGNAIIDASKKMLAAMRKDDGTWRTYDEMVRDGMPTRHIGHYDQAYLGLGGMSPDTGVGAGAPTGMYGVCIAKVQVATKTGKAKVESFRMWADCGVIGNYNSAEGQAYGGLSHDVGFALSEDYDDVDRDDNLLGAGLPYIDDVPDDMQIIWLEDRPRPEGPFGSSGLSELFQSGEHMAVINAIYNATGVRVHELPAYPAKIKAGLDALERGEAPYAPEPYFLGSELYDELDDIAAHPVAPPPQA